MAEFKLGRIRFVWKSDWAQDTVYYKDDVVAYGGKIYICVIGHTAAASFFTDLDIVPPKWNLVSDGQTYKGEWQTNTFYVYDDIVSYGARLYIANEVHTSAETVEEGLEADLAKWNIFAEGLDWKGNWQTSTRYRINDIVKYGGTTYICNTLHTSAASAALGLEANQASWDYFNEGIEYKEGWASGIRYKVNDVVRYGSSLWIATTPHTSTGSFANDESNWQQFVQGFQFEAEWSPSKLYQPGDVVRSGGNQYIANTNHSGNDPQTDDGTNWRLFTEGFRFLGEWNDDSSNIEYNAGEVVSRGGYTYICILKHTDQAPPNPTYWKQLNTGLRWKGVWLDEAEYVLGDVVRFGDNSYVCINGHISEGDDYSSLSVGAENSRPDLDLAGAYWNVLVIGSETSVLDTVGDLVYYSGAGPARLPIGKEGQLLEVNAEGLPEWAYYGVADDVYYVAEHGTDAPAPLHGRTIDKPWRSIRYACEQVDLGVKNRNAAKLLELNRYFIQREIVEWTDYQITNNQAPFTTLFTYAEEKCERDMGYIVDALIWDITHGGNVRSREAALEYVNNAAKFYTLGQEAETVASINYGLSVIEKILANEAPDVNYQVLNGDNSTAIVDQYFDTSLEVEDVVSEITGLVGIITDAITAGNDTNIPKRLIRNVLIKVSTGRYYEMLPIIVPAETCIMGDELRSTNVQPRKAENTTLVDIYDSQFSYRAVERIENIIGDIVQGIAVTPSENNTEDQSREFPFAAPIQAEQASKAVKTIRKEIDFKLGQKLERTLPNPTGFDANYGRARDLILINKDFINAEIIAYLNDNYPDLKYSRTKCKQDVGYILDAVAYDLTYGGNWQSVTAGLAYYAGTSADSQLQIDSDEITATVAAYQYLRDILAPISRNIDVSPVEQTTVLQVSGTGGSVAAAGTVTDLITDIITVLRFGPDNAPAITYPVITGEDAGLQADHAALLAAKSTVQESVIDFINTYFGTFKYDGAKCRRDSEILQTGSAYDIALGTNYNSIKNGIAYTRGTAAEVKTKGQLAQTVGAIREQRDLVEALLADSTAITRNTTYWNEVIDILENGVRSEAVPGDGVVDAIVWTDPGVDSNKRFAREQLQTNRAYIVSELTSWIAANYPAVVYDQATCERDVGYIVDAVSYDVQYGGNSATVDAARAYFEGAVSVLPAGQKAATAAAFAQLASIMSQVVTETYAGQDTSGTAASATEATEVDGLVQIIEDVITADNLNGLPSITYPDYSWATAAIEADADAVVADTTVVPAVLQFITDNYSGFVYDHAKCSRDIGYIVDAAAYDAVFGSNAASITAAYAYRRAPSSKVYGEQKDATFAANLYAAGLFKAEVSEASTEAAVDYAFQSANDQIFIAATNEGSVKQTPEINNWHAVRQIELNKDFIKAEVHAWIDEFFKGTVSSTNGASDTLTIDSTDWMRRNHEIVFENADDSTSSVQNSGLLTTETYYVKDIISDTEFTVSLSRNGATVSLDTNEGGFIVRSNYNYDEAICARDVEAYLDAVKWDITYPRDNKRIHGDIEVIAPSNYKTKLAARYYVNSILGCKEEDFYYLRNNTGLRLQTLDGLQGDLGPANEFGTSRPTAGAYASLDPGWGPNDERVWITARSPYVQNVSTFGYAAVGQKIDGALHAGGNDSIVSNDFTQVISDGIGAWILNNGRGELVSVFTYYSHIGYLCESGGRMRATNGNNSYGTFGSVAEGVDPDEIPVTAFVDNARQYNASITNVFCDGDTINSLEYSHAGNEYTEAGINIFGAGDGEQIVYDDTDFRDDGVFQARITQLNDSSGVAGGSGYTIVSNTAQAGSTSSISLAATDGNIDSAYPGMKVIVTGGAGVGQFGIIDTYNSGTKVATVVRESDGLAGWDHFISGTTIVSPNSSSTYQIEPNVEFSAPPRTSSESTFSTTSDWQDIEYMTITNQYFGVTGTATGTGQGATFNIDKIGSKYYLTLTASGTGYERLETIAIQGSVVGGQNSTNDITITVTAVNPDNGSILAYDFDGLAQKGIFVATGTGTTGNISIDGSTWSAMTMPSPTSGNWERLASGSIDDGSSFLEVGRIVAVSGGSTTGAYSSDGVNWTTFSFSSGSADARISYGNNNFVRISSDSQDVHQSGDGGENWQTFSNALGSTGWTEIAYGQGKFVVIKSGSTEAAYSADGGETWTASTLPASTTWNDIAYGSNKFVAISTGGATGALSVDGGANWSSITLPGAADRIAYGQGVFVCSNSATPEEVFTSEDGVYWESVTGTFAGNQTVDGPIAFGNPTQTGVFVTTNDVSSNLVFNFNIGCKARGRVGIASEQIFEVRIIEPGSGYTGAAPTITITDPGNINDATFQVRVGKGQLAQPSYYSRGSNFEAASAEIARTESNGQADFFQTGDFIAVRRMTERPVPGSNVVFDSLPDQVFKLVNVVSFLGQNDGDYTAFLQISPNMEIADAPADGDPVTMRIRFSQVRLTGHDFLDIGTGNFTTTNYPGIPLIDPDQNKETNDANGGRVFFTATDQDGNFRVGDLFSVEQSTGVATLNAEAFNIAGLQELSLGEVTLGGNSASITEFSTDPFFTANSDTVVPTQRAIKAYIEAQIGGGGASLNVNSVTAGDIFISTNVITTVDSEVINIKAKVNFQGGITGLPLAFNYMLR